MNDTTQTLLRSVLKLLAGALITKGIGDSSVWETIIAGVMAISGVAWGVLHRRTFAAPLLPDSGSSVLPGYTAPRQSPRLPLIPFQLFSISVFSISCTGCTYLHSTTTRQHPDGTIERTQMRATAFFDSSAALAKFKNAAATGTSIGSLNENASSTNVVEILRLVGGILQSIPK